MFQSSRKNEQLPVLIDPHEPRFGVYPHVAADVILGAQSNMSDVVVAVHFARRFLKAREPQRRQPPQLRLLGLHEKPAELLAEIVP